MCGISAVLQTQGDPAAVVTALASMHHRLAHRGPDGEGCLLVDPDMGATRLAQVPDGVASGTPLCLGIGFRQLRIQDTSGHADQPLASSDGRVWVALNGEIYNHDELRRELEGRGHRFHTRSDTEVLLEAYRQWGDDCVDRLVGMWAFLIVDLTRRRLFGSRDRLGIKPLFYSCEGSRVLFGSEPQAVALAGSAGARLDPHQFGEFLSGLPPQSPGLSFFQAVHPVPPGTVFHLSLVSQPDPAPSFRQFWRLSDFVADPPRAPALEVARQEFMQLLRASVESQRRAEVPVGCLLSGGLDTSILARVMARLAADEGAPSCKAYSIVYDDPEMSEWPYIQAVLGQGGLVGRSFRLSPAAAWDSIDSVVRAQGQPLLGQDLIAQYHAYRIAREDGTVVVLQGQGSDEMLAGMPSYETPYLRELLSGLHLVELAREVNARAGRYRRSRLAILRGGFWSPIRDRLSGSLARHRWLEPLPPAAALPSEWSLEPEESSDQSLLNRHLYRLVRRTNLPTVLLHEDRGSMAHGVEARVPFLDHRLVEFCFRLPAAYKIHRGRRKRILLDVAGEWLPPLVLQRTDKKTFVSKRNWMPLRREYAAQIRDVAASTRLGQAPGIRAKSMARFVEDYLRGRHDDALAVWRLCTADRWLAAFGLG